MRIFQTNMLDRLDLVSLNIAHRGRDMHLHYIKGNVLEGVS